jgi:hypothetical protein
MRLLGPSALLAVLLSAPPAFAGVTSIPDIVASPDGNTGGSSASGAASVSAGAMTSLAPTLAAPLPQIAPLPAALAAGPSFVAARPAAVGPAAVSARAAVPAAASAAAAENPHIVFDVRGSRGGNGDVAAAYLTAYDLFARTNGRDDAIVPSVTFVAGQIERGILSRLSGREVGDGGTLFDGQARVVGALSPDRHEPADVLMNLAAHDGEFGREGHIPVRENGIIVTQTVLGNTESDRKGPATVLVGGKRLELSNAGLAKKDGGIYADPVARGLRGRPREEVGRFVLSEAEEADVKGSAAIAAILKKEVLAGSEMGLAYGIGMSAVKPQFERYLSGLAARAARENGSFVVATPSVFDIADVKNDSLRSRIVILDGDVPLPEFSQKGTIYVLKTGTLPHRLFVGLMAYSRPPPILAGDGAMSAAVGLGRPFVMTQVPWNAANLKVFAERIAARAPREKRALVEDVYLHLKLERASELDALAPSYAATARAIPVLTDTLFVAVQAARELDSGKPTSALLNGVDDERLKSSLLVSRSLEGDPEALTIAEQTLRAGDERSRGLLVSGILRGLPDRLSFLRPFLSADFMPVNALAARLALRFVSAAERRRAPPATSR